MLTILISMLLSSTTALATPWSDSAKKVVDSIINEVGASSENYGIYLARGDEIFAHNENRLFVPASLSKIPTALTVMEEQPRNQLFKTWIYHTGQIVDGVLRGDLYLKGGGDPSLVSEVLWRMVKELKRSDIKRIDGKLYVDESYFDSDYYSEGRQQRRVDRAYDAPVSALSFNWNSITIHVRPGEKRGDAARVYLDPNLPSIELVNRATTKASGKQNLRVDRTTKNGKVKIRVTGKIPKTLDEKTFYKSISEAALWTGQSFKQLLNQQGIAYRGEVQKGVVPKRAILLVEQDSWSFARILSALSKFSNNFVAEMLTKHLGKTKGEPASIDEGLKKITDFLSNRGWKPEDYKFLNPSGFTRDNKMKARLLGELLQKSKEDFAVAPEFLSSLPISGIDGTLKKRMTQVMRGKVRAKTGYLTGVVGLAGYLERRGGGDPITFVLFYNGPNKYDWKVRAAFDKILWRIYQKS